MDKYIKTLIVLETVEYVEAAEAATGLTADIDSFGLALYEDGTVGFTDISMFSDLVGEVVCWKDLSDTEFVKRL